MKSLTRKEKEQIGFSFVVEQLNPITPYGKEKVKELQPFSSDEMALLKDEFEIQEKILVNKQVLLPLQKQMELLLMGMKQVGGSIEKAQTSILTEVDFFELKSVAIILEKLMPLMNEYVEVTGMQQWKLSDVKALLALLDPEGERVPSFYISHLYMPELKDIREEKRQVEIKLRTEKEQVGALKKLRDEIVEREEACNRKVLENLTESFKEYISDLKHNLDIIAHVDLVWQKVLFAQKYDCIRPTIEATGFFVEQMRHPAIEELLNEKGETFTPLSLDVTPGVCVITGANMGGKSVALKTAALLTYLAYHGFFVPAKKFVVPNYEEIFLIMDEYEEVNRGLSSFGGEIVKIRECLEQMGNRRCLVFMDEPARGTNPEEGAKIVRALVRYLNRTNADVFVATHYEHISELANSHYQVYGLKSYTDEELEKAVAGLGNKDRVKLLSKYMNYGLYRVKEQEGFPQDAIRVCHLLGLQEEILKEL